MGKTNEKLEFLFIALFLTAMLVGAVLQTTLLDFSIKGLLKNLLEIQGNLLMTHGGSDWIRLDQIGSDWIRLDQMT